MSIADFVLAFVGIIVGLGVADLLTSLHKLLRAGKRVTWHWATPFLAALTLLVTLVLVLSFLMMAAALPDEVPESGIDLKQFYLGSRVHLWSLMSATFGGFLFFYWLDNWSLGVARLLAVSWLPITSFALAVTATVSARMWVHALAIGWISAGMLYNNLFWSIGR